uniref:Variant surface glycoprotein 1125.445 n=1 Tax=Trypanosoma brucei TaxID=5691 RepID=A0A1J0R5X1_9TRYP|nr:variant surface glycoprotein 1125.445 [Trypanosoma brucei]
MRQKSSTNAQEQVARREASLTRSEQTLFVITGLLMAGIAARPTGAAGPAAGTYASDFALLCNALNVASAQVPAPEVPAEPTDAEEAAALINITLLSPEALAELTGSSSAETAISKPSSTAGKECVEVAASNCVKAANRHKTAKTDKAYQLIKGADFSDTARQALAAQAQAVLQLATELRAELLKAKADTAQKLLRQAVGPAADGNAAITATTPIADRVAACGKSGSNAAKGKLAGESIAADLLCICGKDSQQTQAAVCGSVSISDGDITWATMANGPAQWKRLHDACKTHNKARITTAATIRATVSAVLQATAGGSGGNNAKTYMLGAALGTGDDGCDGVAGTNGGCCVYYGPQTDTSLAIKWAQKMLGAADAIEKAQAAAQKAFRLAENIQQLNKTMTTIALMAAAAPKQTANVAGGTALPQNADQCEELTKSAECRKKSPICKWEGTDDKDGPHCKSNETNVAKQETQAGTGGTKKTSECKDKQQKDCTGNCKWENNACNDCSFIVNKNFALIAAAFVSFLFSIFSNLRISFYPDIF